MASKFVIAIGATVAAIFVAAFLREPSIDGATHPLQLRLLLMMVRWGNEYKPELYTRLGLGDLLTMTRSGCDFKQEPTAGVKIKDITLDGVPTRLYFPPDVDPSGETSKLLPGIVYYHGGGWIICGLDGPFVPYLSRLCQDTGAIIVAVGYGLAPENTLLDILDDCFKVTRLVLERAADFGIDPARVALAGDSAGGQLTLSMGLKLRDQGIKPQPKLLVPIYPITQFLDLNFPSYHQNSDGPFVTRKVLGWCYSIALLGNDTKQDVFLRNGHVSSEVRAKMAATHLNHANVPERLRRLSPYKSGDDDVTFADDVTFDENVWIAIKDTIMNPYVSPLLADDLSGLPMTIFYIAQNDVLRDEGILMAQRMEQAGVPVFTILDPLGWHAGLMFADADVDCKNALATVARAISERL